MEHLHKISLYNVRKPELDERCGVQSKSRKTVEVTQMESFSQAAFTRRLIKLTSSR